MNNVYVFSVSDVFVEYGDVYVSGNSKFLVSASLDAKNNVFMNLVCYGENDPEESGILKKVSGLGDAEIEYDSFKEISKLKNQSAMKESFVAAQKSTKESAALKLVSIGGLTKAEVNALFGTELV